MKKTVAIVLTVLFVASPAFAEVGFRGRPITNNLWMSTGYTLNRGEFIVGIGPIGFGVTDNVQVGTNILLFLFQFYNANVKVSLVEKADMALAVGLSLGRFDLAVFDSDASFTTLSPYVSVSPKLSENTTLHLGGQYSYFSSDADIEDAEAEASSSGTSVFAGLEYSMTHKTKFLVETGYDLTFEGMRLGGGVLFGWEKFRLKLGVSYFKPEGTDGFTFPHIGLWWRFMG
jgi:hypothetical protein